MGLKLENMRLNLRSSLWFLPAVSVAIVVALAIGTVELDRRFEDSLRAIGFGGTAESARGLLSTITSAMITFTGLVFTITMVVLQLASQQFSPRVLRTFLRDRSSQTALSVFVATFTFAMVLLREVRGPETDAVFVPRLGITIAFALVLLSVGVFVHYINHIAHSIRAVSIIASVARETRRLIDRRYPDDATPREPAPPREVAPDQIVPNGETAGTVVAVDTDALVRAARKAECTLVLVPRVGDFVPANAPLFEVHSGGDISDEVTKHVRLGRERTMQQDVPFGFRQLVDIAERALSPGVNDPTTAVQAIDHLHDLLRRLSRRPFPDGIHRDEDGRIRLVVAELDFADFVHLATDEIRQYGGGSVQVCRRLRAMLQDLMEVAPPDRIPPLKAELRMLDATIERNFPDAGDRASASEGDNQGLGDQTAD